MRLAIDVRQRGQPVERPLVLADDEREERQLERVGLALQDAELVLADVRVLRRVDDVAQVGELGAERVVVLASAPWDCTTSCGRPSSPCWQTTTGRFSPGFRSLGKQQDAVGEDVRVEVERDLVALPLRRVVQLAGLRVHRLGRVGQLADDFFVEELSDRLDRLLVLLGRGDIDLGRSAAARAASLSRQTFWVKATSWSNWRFWRKVGVEASCERRQALDRREDCPAACEWPPA